MAVVRRMIHSLKDLHLRLGELGRAETSFDFEPDEATRQEMAKAVSLTALPAFQARLAVSIWLDGAEIGGVWTAQVTQTCGVSLDTFDTPLAGQFTVRVVPPDSPHAPVLGAEVDLDPDADDPPDVLESDRIDLGAYVVEHLALEIDPFPRKPGAVFELPQSAEIISPFAALKTLKP